MARHSLIFLIICFASCGLHVRGVNGTQAEAQAEGNSNYSTQAIRNNNSHGVMFEPGQTGQPPNIGNGKVDYFKSVQQMHFIQPAGTLKSLNIVKRAPNGFTGLRGKKQNELTQNGIEWNNFDWPHTLDVEVTEGEGEVQAEEKESDVDEQQLDTADPDTWQYIRNTWSPIINGRRFKKAPTAFYGVRGKKFADGGSQINNLQDLMQQLQAERIRDELLQDFLDRITMSTDYMNEIEKRTPAGFMGMRGKRAMPDYRVVDTAGDVAADDISIAHQAYKRSPPNHVSFYGTRGKKQPFIDFRNKFVGVRGKKDSTAEPTVQQSLTESNPEQSTELLLSAAEQNYNGGQPRYLVNMLPLFYDTIYKRTPNGFMGMRGKRATTTNVAKIMATQQYSKLKDSTAY